MKPEVVFALYRPHEEKDREFRALLAQHLPILRARELVTDREPIVVKSTNGTYIEIFEWRGAESATRAHHDPEVAKIWEAMGQIATLPTLGTLDEIDARFPHFEPVAL